MLRTCALILPALIPSWRFFETVEASPRIEWKLLPTGTAQPDDWRALRPRPDTITPLQMLLRLFWNPTVNEALYTVSCAERIVISDCARSIVEITSRILADICELPLDTRTKLMQFRIVFVARGDTGLTRETVFLSTPIPTHR